MTENLYPLDWKSLVKGQLITVEECERACGVRRDNPKYGLRLLRVKDYIMRCRAEAGEPISIRTSKGALLVLDDSSASIYHTDRADGSVACLARHAHRLATIVDRSKLSAGEQPSHDRAVALNAARIFAIRKMSTTVVKEIK